MLDMGATVMNLYRPPKIDDGCIAEVCTITPIQKTTTANKNCQSCLYEFVNQYVPITIVYLRENLSQR